MNEQENTKLVRQAYHSFNDDDIETLLNSFSEDIQWQLPEIENVPFSGKWHGRERVGQFFSKLAETQDAVEFNPKDFIAQNDKVVVLGNYTWKIKASGKEFGGDWAHVWTVNNGQIAGFHEYMDTAAAYKAFAAAQAA